MVEKDLSLDTPNIEQAESLKIIKNSRGYNWEIKIFPRGSDDWGDLKANDDLWLARMEFLNNAMMIRFGSLSEGKDE
jgi:hypothetical protein